MSNQDDHMRKTRKRAFGILGGAILTVVYPPAGIALAAASVLGGARRYAQSGGDDLDAGIDMVMGISDASGGDSNRD